MSESLTDFDSWPTQIASARIPANNNVRRMEILTGPVISATTTAQPGSPNERDIYIIPSGATGSQWGSFLEDDIAIYYEATWTAFEPFQGLRKFVEDEGEDWQYIGDSSGGWAPASGGGGGAVDSVNGQTGVVVLDAADVGAATTAQGVTADSAVQPGDLAAIATTGDPADLISPVPLSKGGTGANLVDPNADRILFWDDSSGVFTWLTLGTNLSITGTTINAAGGGGGSGDVVGPASAVDDRIATYDGATGKLIQDGGATIAQIDPRGKHAVPVMAGAMSPSTTGGSAPLSTIASAANQPDIQSLNFDATTVEYAQFAIPMPVSWDEGTVTFAPIWSHAATTTNFGVVWQLQGVAVSNDDTIAVNFGTVQTSTDTGGTTNDIYIGPESSAITLAGTPAAGDVAFFRVARLTTDGSDNMAIDARLHGIVLYITTNAPNDA